VALRILIEIIPHSEQRLGVPGDWFWEGDTLHVKISDVEDWRYEFLYARHEMDEAVLCRNVGITTEEVDAHCLEYKDKPGNPDSFSGYPGASYQTQHNDALAMEWIMSRALGISWQDYDAAFEKLKEKK
jgi:hypothetical protein